MRSVAIASRIIQRNVVSRGYTNTKFLSTIPTTPDVELKRKYNITRKDAPVRMNELGYIICCSKPSFNPDLTYCFLFLCLFLLHVYMYLFVLNN